jgi:hypothetical protein
MAACGAVLGTIRGFRLRLTPLELRTVVGLSASSVVGK